MKSNTRADEQVYLAVAFVVVCHDLMGEEIMEKHLTILGILNIVMGALGLFAACFVLILVGGGSQVASEASGESGLLALGDWGLLF
ncbi:MAG: hypothetical protein ACE5FH_00270 [Candidatus Zixiibacteriota bacterium]